MYWHNKILGIIAAALLTGCATTPTTQTPISEIVDALCQNEIAIIDVNFPASRANHCQIKSPTSLKIIIDPENKPINSSAWYAFRVTPNHAGTLRVNLKYSHAKHRYPPKISYDGIKWEVFDPTKIDKLSKDEIRMRIPLKKRPIYIAAQEIFSVGAHNTWIKQTEKLPFVSKSIIGNSIEGRPLYKLEARTNPKIKKPYVVFVGRQHPPEVTGALAFMPFAETVLGDSKLAKSFRSKYDVILIPNMNPDGVTHGNWRHNMNGVDLNRDWGPFKQPETQAVEKEFRRFKNGDDKIVLFLDFHSTWRNLLYTQTDAEPTNPVFFTRDWIKAVNDRLDDKTYKFTREQNPNSGKPVSKNYMYMTYGIPAITFEVGDNTDRKSIAIAADIFAQEMMKTLLNPEHK
ncbi:MAG: M14 family zinc carboxypeptidase [Robiginitomaculum sp.]